MERFEKKKPSPEDTQHKTELFAGEEEVGSTFAQYFSKPFPYYYLGYITTYEGHQGKGYASKLLDDFEQKLKETGRAGVLNDYIAHNNGKDSPAVGMYERRGWQRVPGTNVLTFNLPAGVTDQDIRGLMARKNSPTREARVVKRFNRIDNPET